MTDDLFDSPAGASTGQAQHDHLGRYVIPDPETGKPFHWTRATTFAKAIADTYRLDKWGNRMAVKGLTMRPDLYAAVAATPLDHRDELDELADKAKEAAGAKASATLGSALHAFAEQLDKGQRPTVPPPWQPDIDAYALGRERLRAVHIERTVVNLKYRIAGTFDRIEQVAEPIHLPILGVPPLLPDEYVINDLKTGRDLEYGWNEIAVQLAVYANADLMYDWGTRSFEPMPALRKDIALVMHVPVGGRKCTIYVVDIRLGWQAAALCHAVRQWRKLRNLAYPMGTVSVDDGPPAPRELTWEDRISMASSDGELSRIRKEAMAQGQWSKRLLQAGMVRQRALTS